MRRLIPGRDHLWSNLGIISGPGIICGPIWGSFPVLGSFAGLYREMLGLELPFRQTAQMPDHVTTFTFRFPLAVFSFSVKLISFALASKNRIALHYSHCQRTSLDWRRLVSSPSREYSCVCRNILRNAVQNHREQRSQI